MNTAAATPDSTQNSEILTPATRYTSHAWPFSAASPSSGEKCASRRCLKWSDERQRSFVKNEAVEFAVKCDPDTAQRYFVEDKETFCGYVQKWASMGCDMCKCLENFDTKKEAERVRVVEVLRSVTDEMDCGGVMAWFEGVLSLQISKWVEDECVVHEQTKDSERQFSKSLTLSCKRGNVFAALHYLAVCEKRSAQARKALDTAVEAFGLPRLSNESVTDGFGRVISAGRESGKLSWEANSIYDVVKLRKRKRK